ncbi:hypothetical protein [Kistimonas asteriae]|uniref:hypothetical protein n=1 Tax=Kistimonas asteriae TaxID=517724 RepID=UPI001BACFE83|nr:hypothetical protein [Kistimonas asteriae]
MSTFFSIWEVAGIELAGLEGSRENSKLKDIDLRVVDGEGVVTYVSLKTVRPEVFEVFKKIGAVLGELKEQQVEDTSHDSGAIQEDDDIPF